MTNRQTNDQVTDQVVRSTAKMTVAKKLLIALCAVVSVAVIVATSVLATVAYLTSSAVVSNTFTIGKVGITLDEAKVDTDGKIIDGAERVKENVYNLVPNASYSKDPTVHVNPGSENSYLFVLIRNDIEAIADTSDPANKPTIAQQLERNGWAKYTLASTGWVYVWVGEDNVPENDAAKTDGSATFTATALTVNSGDYVLFEKFHIASNADTTAYGAAKITVTAVAIQDEGFADVNAAWEAVKVTYPYIHTGGN